jgi:hypothetical protein
MILATPGGRVNVPAPLRYRDAGSTYLHAPRASIAAAEATEAG